MGAAIAACIAGVAGCGGDDSSAGQAPRPATTIVLTASISRERVLVSPRRFGAGPVDLVITNQSGARQVVTFASDGGRPTQNTGPISPADTATLRLDVPQGRAMVRVDGGRIRRATLTVGPQRASSEDKLLLP